MTELFSNWRRTPWWLRLLGKAEWMRDRYASPMIGGGWDGWDFSDPAMLAARTTGEKE